RAPCSSVCRRGATVAARSRPRWCRCWSRPPTGPSRGSAARSIKPTSSRRKVAAMHRAGAATLAMVGMVSGGSSPPSIVATVKAPGNIDKLWIVVRDEHAEGHPLVLSKVEEDVSRGGSLRFDGEGVRVSVDVATPGQYGLILVGWSGTIECLD